MTQRRILVVDDEKNIRFMLSQTLASDATAVETAVNGEEALQKLQHSRYDLMLLDLRMPGMAGLEVLRQVHARYPDMPIILLTAHGTVESAVEALRGGAVNFLQKPFSPREIRDAVDKALEERRSTATAGRPEDATPNSRQHERPESDAP